MTDGVRLMTWNIHGAVGTDRRCDPERILRIVRAAQADIVILQEVDGRSHLGRKPNAFEFFRDGLGPNCAEARMFGRPGREHGNLLWSRWPIDAATVHRLPGGIEPRGLIEATIETPEGPLTVLGSHFSLSIKARRQQADAAAARAGASAHPVALAGDFNEWAPNGPVHRRLARALPVHLRPKSWPSRRPFVAMDRIYASRGTLIRAIEMPADALVASDHHPVFVELTRPGAACRPGTA